MHKITVEQYLSTSSCHPWSLFIYSGSLHSYRTKYKLILSLARGLGNIFTMKETVKASAYFEEALL